MSVTMDEPGPLGCLGHLGGSHLGVNPQGEGGEGGEGGGGPTPEGSGRWQPARVLCTVLGEDPGLFIEGRQ